MMTIQQIVEESRKLGITYGQYVQRMKSDAQLIKPETVKKVKSDEFLKKCEICGKEFLFKSRNQKYCSAWCQHTASYMFRRERLKTTGTLLTCPVCGKEFRGKANRKYCSRECALVAMRARKI